MRALQFYLEKARRHSLDATAYQKLRDQLDRLIRDGAEYRISEPTDSTRGYVFCPEMSRAEPELVSRTAGGTGVLLFGPSRLPDLIAGFESPPSDDDNSAGGMAGRRPTIPDTPQSPSTTESSVSESEGDAPPTTPTSDEATNLAGDPVVTGPDAVAEETSEANGTETPRVGSELESSPAMSQVARIILGTDAFSDADVEWQVTSKANPHLMIVGLPGTGLSQSSIGSAV